MVKDIIFQRNFFRFIFRIFLWHFRYATTRGVWPLACGFYITSKCNFQCEFCNIWKIKPAFQMSEACAQRMVKELGKMGLLYLSFSGGEPLLVPYLFDLLTYAKESSIIYTHIVSNGYLMDERRAKKLAEANVSEISFSLDGEENVHDKNRGVSGAFGKVIEAIDCVRTYAPKTKIVLNTILDPIHPENAISAVKRAGRLRVKIKVQPENEHPDFGISGCFVKSRRPLQTNEKQNLFEAINLIQSSPYVVNSKAFLENYKTFMFCPGELIFAKDDCIFGYHHIEFFANQIFPCLEGLNWKEGFDISRGSVKEILTSPPYRKKLEQLRRCSHCQKNYYVCYYEPRLNFPMWNLIKSRLRMPKITVV